MGLSSCQPDHAGHRADAHRPADRRKTPSRLCAGAVAGGLSLLLALLLALPGHAADLTLATWHADLSRDGPGLLLRDLQDPGPDLQALVAQVTEAAPDVLLLTHVDFDTGGAALAALAALLAEGGAAYPHRLALLPNTGMATGRDLDGDGRLGGARDAQGYGRFAGQGGMALLSRWPLVVARDLSELLWRDLPQSRIAADDPGHDLQRLSSTGHWVVTLDTPEGPLTLLAFAATPPVFDGPEDRNGRRNADELRLWSLWMEGGFDGGGGAFRADGQCQS
jgi:hypothetical protein